MKAVIFTSVKEPLHVEELPTPKPAEHEVLVKVAGCGICHTDIGFWRDGVPTKHARPLVLGHEISGTVVETSRYDNHLLNKEVIIPAVVPCMDCDLCRAGRGNICRYQLMPGNDIHGGFAEYIAVPDRGLCVVEAKSAYPLSELSVVADAVTTPYQAVVRSGLQGGEVAIVIGVGGVGGYAVQIAAAFGARVIALDVDEERLALMSRHGAAAVFNVRTMDFKELKAEIQSRVKRWGAPQHRWKIFECSGTAAGQQTAFGLINTAATLMIIGFTLDKTELRLSNLMAMDATVQGTWGCKAELYPDALRLVTEGKIDLKPFVHTYPMSAGPKVLDDVAAHRIRHRAILVPDWQP